MNLPEEDTKVKHSSNKASVLMFLALFVVVIVLALFVYLKSQNIDLSEISLKELITNPAAVNTLDMGENSFELKYDAREHPVYTLYGEYIIQCSKDSVKGLNKNGEEQWSIPVSVANPLVKISGNSMLVADIGGKGIYVINGKAVKWSKKLDNSIINADISDNGYVSVVHEAKGYKGAVTVFNLQGGEYFTRYIGENFTLMARVSPSGKSVVIDSVDASGVTTGTVLEFTDTFGKPLAKVTKQDMLIPVLWYLEDDSVVTGSNNAITCFDRNGRQKWEQQFSKVFSANVVLDKYIAAAVGENDKKGSEGKINVELVDSNGKFTPIYGLNDEVRDIQAYSNIIAVNTGNDVYFINTRGKLIRKYSSKTDIVKVCFFNKQEAAVVTKGTVTVIKIGGI